MNKLTPSPLANKADVVRGVTFSKGDAIARPREGYTPVLRAGNIQGHLILDSDLVYVPQHLVTDKQRIRCGDIVMCTSSGSADIVGKTAFSHQDWNGSFGAFCAVVRPKAGQCNPRYLFHYLQTPSFREWTRNSSGVGIKNIRKSELDSVEIPFPSPDEQRRIAAILDKADAVRRKREQALTLADDFLKSVFVEMFGRPKQPNPALKTRPLGETCNLFAGNSLPAGEPYIGQSDGHLLLKVGDLNLPGNDQTVMTAREWLTEKARMGAAIVAPKNAIVFPKRGGAIATNKKRILGRSCILDPNLMAVAPKPDSVISYPYLRVWIELLDLASISNGSTVPQLNKGDLSPLEMPIPGREDLLAFDQLFHGLNRLHGKLVNDLMSAEALFSSLSQRAFQGEL
ncbi:restriction endonuclease subunit S [Sinorhizobium meliloti]|uniref:restriction endonuclease subunit S n=1 Tax=Rhizobium meliloti TaxID=382 RepID=UPI000FDC50A8|nr:restriction endonuclease subunit S [Sinorhizobium meliloti]RVM95944.1 restriction endonuclease subunit S [Sinorhizobium meliloti]